MAVTDERPDPDALLARVQAQEADARRGRLKIFFGASAGVGKTYAMLSAARALQPQGEQVLVGLVETHKRRETEALVAGLEVLPRRALPYRERTLEEFDLDAALARKPALILVDELAHSNVAGSRHPKRWQDVQELLAAGIDVWTTMNVQHLESLNDIVSGITGIRVNETVPDHVFDEADEVVVVDLPPDELLQRLKEGKVYLPQQAESAVANFFRKGNLLALRELALRRTADRVDDEMRSYRSERSVSAVWPTREALLACIGPVREQGEKIVRASARLAGQLDIEWHVVFVETPALQRLPQPRRDAILRVLRLAEELGARTATLSGADVAAPLVRYARQHNLARVVIGRSARRRWPWQPTLAERVGELAPEVDVVQVALAPGSAAADAVEAPPRGGGFQAPAIDYLKSAAICGVAALAATPLLSLFELVNLVMFFLLAVVIVALRYGRGPAVLAAFLSVAVFDFFFVPPRFSFAVSDVQYLLTFAVMLLVALVIGQTTAGLTYQARVASRREARAQALYEMSRELTAALMPEQVAAVAGRFLEAEFEAAGALLLMNEADRLDAPLRFGAGPEVALDLEIARWCLDRGEPAGPGTGTLPASAVLYLPLQAPMRVRGVLALQPRRRADRLLIPEQRQLLETCASLLAISIERLHYVEVASRTSLQMEGERLRNSLLAALSHDLRTPLTSIVGLAETLQGSSPPLAGAQREMAQGLAAGARQMHALVHNLLDMARLQGGAVRLKRAWMPIEEVIGSAIRSLAPVLDGRRVEVRLAEALPLVEIDALLIERVIANLLENAVKYTPDGSPIEIEAALEQGGARLRLDVRDHGPGLPPGKERAIFEAFTRGASEAAAPGVGLGLSIARTIVEAHDGRLEGRSCEQGGALFSLWLPLGVAPAAWPEAHSIS
ncbi:two-component system sensor histidine kinase KdpD [Rivibacter subsaxonicus]|uniref:histidine kinase n=1 Tax=Rivibacter subsaxonicus TaxID=457575 RepID=A0A4Q7W0C2_9BURK|nr:two-component system sensor histidine kinase KdpD [Rivibacter subsaxonicus]RZU02607.1 two-component system sensor histidine kinase KdpD [Rivibacter subsaxonicus]